MDDAIEYKYPMTDHLRLSKITINRTEGLALDIGKRDFLSTAEAEAYLRQAATTAPFEGGCDACDFVLTFSDGNQYEGRIDLKAEHVNGYSIARHVRQQCEFYAGVSKPEGLPQAQYEEFLSKAVRPEDKAQFADWLNVYVPVIEQDCQPLKAIEASFRAWQNVGIKKP